ncbi:MAG TPA: hypothetical protein VIK86_08540, partial [Candidatus Paceibacterota bacterium]
EMNNKSCFIMGLPSAGKTTYLAALWYSLQQPNKTMLRLNKYIGNHKYLTKLSETWTGLEKVSRTSIDNEEKKLNISLVDMDKTIYEVSFPDLSGESFQKQYVDREIDKDTAEYITKCGGILVFINPEETTPPPCFITEINYETRIAFQSIGELVVRKPLKDDPTEVQLVELLQFITFLRQQNHINIGIIVSAWDTLEPKQFNIPEKFIKEQLPLLWQYLYSNAMLFSVSYFGISAQGGPLENEGDIEKLANVTEPVHRIMVMDNYGNFSHDVTLPLLKVLQEKAGEIKI